MHQPTPFDTPTIACAASIDYDRHTGNARIRYVLRTSQIRLLNRCLDILTFFPTADHPPYTHRCENSCGDGWFSPGPDLLVTLRFNADPSYRARIHRRPLPAIPHPRRRTRRLTDSTARRATRQPRRLPPYR